MSQGGIYYNYRSLVDHGSARAYAMGSVLLHAAIALAVVAWPLLAPGIATASLGGGGGGGRGGQSGEAIGVGLVGGLPAGAEWYKPPVRPIKPPERQEVPAVERPAAAPAETAPPKELREDRREDMEQPAKKDDFQVQTSTKTRPEPVKPPPAKADPKTGAARQAAPETSAPAEGTPAKAEGVRGARGGSGGGEVSGEGGSPGNGGGGPSSGVSIGLGKGFGDGLGNDWYSQEVERRVGSNWLRSLMEIRYANRQRVVVQFEVRADGRVENITIVESQAVRAFERLAYRAVQASDPLPPLPTRYTIAAGRVRFLAVFEYPPPQ